MLPWILPRLQSPKSEPSYVTSSSMIESWLGDQRKRVVVPGLSSHGPIPFAKILAPPDTILLVSGIPMASSASVGGVEGNNIPCLLDSIAHSAATSCSMALQSPRCHRPRQVEICNDYVICGQSMFSTRRTIRVACTILPSIQLGALYSPKGSLIRCGHSCKQQSLRVKRS